MDNKDINVNISGKTFNSRASILIFNSLNNKFLVQKRIGDLVWALPGGKVQIMEKTKDTIKREIKEEIGLDLIDIKMLSVSENFFTLKNEDIHQYIFTYSGKLVDKCYEKKEEFESIEKGKNVVYRWVDVENIDDYEIRPDNVKDIIKGYLENKILFFD